MAWLCHGLTGMMHADMCMHELDGMGDQQFWSPLGASISFNVSC